MNAVESFYDAARKGQVVGITSQRGEVIQVSPTPAVKHDSLPAFDFGRLNDPPASGSWERGLFDELWNEFVAAGSISLPFDHCIYIFRFGLSGSDHETINLMTIAATATGFKFSNYFFHPQQTGLHGRWTRHPVAATVHADTVDYNYHHPLSRFDSDAQASLEEDVRAHYTAIVNATLLMNRRALITREPTDDDMTALNTDRAKAKLPPVPQPIRIRLGEVVRNAPVGGEGSPKCPHDRRGHYRTLKRSGKRVWVQPSAIHGGGTKAREYRVGG